MNIRKTYERKGYANLQRVFQKLWAEKAILAIFFIGCGLRFYGLDSKSLWLDELQDWFISQCSSFSKMITYARWMGQVPTWYFFNHFYISIFGDSVFALRFLPATFGSLSILQIYFLGKKLFNPFVGLVSSAYMATSCSMLWHSQDFRPYSLMVFLSILSVSKLYDCVFKSENLRKNIVVYSLICFILSQIHFFGLFFVLLQSLIIFYVFFEKRKIRWPLLIPLGLTSLCSLPTISTLIRNMGTVYEFHTARHGGLIDYFSTYWKYSFLSFHPIFLWGMAGLHILLPLYLMTHNFLKRNEDNCEIKKMLCLIMWGFFPLVLFWFVQSFIKESGFVMRYVLFSMPALYLLTGFYFDSLLRFPYRKLVIIPLLLIIGLGNVFNAYNYYNRPKGVSYRSAMQTVTPIIREHQPLIISYTAYNLWKHYWRYYLRDISPNLNIDVSLVRDATDRFNEKDYNKLEGLLKRDLPSHIVLLVREDLVREDSESHIPQKLWSLFEKNYRMRKIFANKDRIYIFSFTLEK